MAIVSHPVTSVTSHLSHETTRQRAGNRRRGSRGGEDGAEEEEEDVDVDVDVDGGGEGAEGAAGEER